LELVKNIFGKAAHALLTNRQRALPQGFGVYGMPMTGETPKIIGFVVTYKRGSPAVLKTARNIDMRQKSQVLMLSLSPSKFRPFGKNIRPQQPSCHFGSGRLAYWRTSFS